MSVLKEQDRCQESAVFQGEVKPRLDKATSTVSGLKVLGKDSPSRGRHYQESAHTDLAAHINSSSGVKGNLNHNIPDGSVVKDRKVQDRFGKFFNGRVVDGETFADFKFNPKHGFAEQFQWFVTEMPDAIGCSIDAMLRGPIDPKTNVKLVNSIPKTFSIDFVSDAGTTKSLFESYDPKSDPMVEDGDAPGSEEPLDEPDDEPGADEHLALALMAVAKDSSLDRATKRKKVLALLSLMSDDEPADEPKIEPKDKKPVEEKDTKELESLRLEVKQLRLDLDTARAVESARLVADAKVKDRADAEAACSTAAKGDVKIMPLLATKVFLDNLVERGRESWGEQIADRLAIVKPADEKPKSAGSNPGSEDTLKAFEQAWIGAK